MPPSSYLALLRGINVSGKNRIRMDALREMFSALPVSDVRTYIQTGNVVFTAGGAPGRLEDQIEAAILATFTWQVPVMVRTAEQWDRMLRACPLPAEAVDDPSRLYVHTAKRPFPVEMADALMDRARDGEVVRLTEGSLWIHYPSGLARSKITPGLLDRLAGSPTTARNWRTASALLEMGAKKPRGTDPAGL